MLCSFTALLSEHYCKFGNFREILFSRIALKDVFATFKICNEGMIYLFQLTTECSRHCVMVLYSRNF